MKEKRLFFCLFLFLLLLCAGSVLAEKSAEDYFISAREHQEAGNTKEALRGFNKAIQLNPKLYYVHYYRGMIKSENGDWKGAIADFGSSINIYGGFVDAYYARGGARIRSGDYRGAVEDFSAIIKVRKYSADAYFSRGIAFVLLKETENACADFLAAKKLGSKQVKKAIPKYCSPTTNSDSVNESDQGNNQTASHGSLTPPVQPVTPAISGCSTAPAKLLNPNSVDAPTSSETTNPANRVAPSTNHVESASPAASASPSNVVRSLLGASPLPSANSTGSNGSTSQ